MVDILKIIEGKDIEDIELEIRSNFLSKDFYIQVAILNDKSFSFFAPIIRNCLQHLLNELSQDDDVLDYFDILESWGYEEVDERRRLFELNEYSDSLKELDLDLADRIVKIGDALNK